METKKTYYVTARLNLGELASEAGVKRSLESIRFVERVDPVKLQAQDLTLIGPTTAFHVTVPSGVAAEDCESVKRALAMVKYVHRVAIVEPDPVPSVPDGDILTLVWENPRRGHRLDHVAVYNHGRDYGQCQVYFGDSDAPVGIADAELIALGLLHQIAIVRDRHGMGPIVPTTRPQATTQGATS